MRTRVSALWLDGTFLNVRFLPGAEVELEHAVECVETAAGLAGDVKRGVIVDLRDVRSQTSAAREHFASARATRFSYGVSLVASSPLSRIIGNFFLGFNRPSNPTRLFGSESEAEAWLGALMNAP